MLQADAGLLLIGPEAAIDPVALHAYLGQGGRVFFLPQAQGQGLLGSSFEPAAAQFAGSLSAPDWPEARGPSASDLRWRCYLDTRPWLVSGGVEIGADGLGPRTWGPRPSGNAKPRGAEVPQHYHPDYISECPMGDNPDRYYRW